MVKLSVALVPGAGRHRDMRSGLGRPLQLLTSQPRWPGPRPNFGEKRRNLHRILDDIRDKVGERYGNDEAQDGDVGFMEARSSKGRPQDEEDERAQAGVDDVLKGRHPLDDGKGI